MSLTSGAPVYKEADFPLDYREAEVRQIMAAIYRLRSIAVTGLAGMGKSNVIRFIVSHPQVRARYLQERADDYVLLHIDCAGLAQNSEDEILGEIIAQLCVRGLATGESDLPEHLRTLRRSLKTQILRMRPDLTLVLILDYFDEAAAALDRAFFNYLFYLRNARPQGNLSYILVTRRPLGHLHELHELLDDGCFVGPLAYKDALGSLRRDETRLGVTFTPNQGDRLIACTGGHPGFLKNAAELLGSGRVDATLLVAEIARQLLRADKIRSLCRDLWGDLTSEEQAILLKVAVGIPLRGLTGSSGSEDRARVTHLERSGLLTEGQGETRAIFSPLFAAFVRELASSASGKVRVKALFPNRAQIETPTGEETFPLSPKLFALLLALTEAQGQVLSTDELIARVYADEAGGVTNAALSQLIKRLRKALNPRLRTLTEDPAYDCVETIRDVGYRFNG